MSEILLIDDDYSNRITLAALLEDEGFVLTEAESVATARQVVSEKVDFRVILLDYHLGDGLGTELIPELREKMPDAKIALISGSIELSAAAETGVDAVVPKGSDFPVLLQEVKNLAA